MKHKSDGFYLINDIVFILDDLSETSFQEGKLINGDTDYTPGDNGTMDLPGPITGANIYYANANVDIEFEG